MTHETTAYLNAIGTAVPPYDMHAKFREFAPAMLSSPRHATLLRRMAERAGVDHRFSVLAPHPDPGRVDSGGFYRRGAFPDTRRRMALFEQHATALSVRAVAALGTKVARAATHLIVTCCTGFTGPGVDFQLAEAIGMDRGVERTMVGFMGCSAALNALKLARHTVRSERGARVLVVNVELCTLHMRETDDLAEMLSFLIFADGCAASLVSAEPRGFALEGFASTVIPDSADHITWRIGESGFLMHLSGALPASVAQSIATGIPGAVAGGEPAQLWAVHPGGRSILDAVERGAGFPIDLSASREVLRRYGNMSSPTVMFVMERLLRDPAAAGAGCMVAFGPGVTVEAARFHKLS